MKFTTFLLILLFPLLLYGDERFEVSDFFATPHEATEYANKLPEVLKASAQFVVEFDGKSQRTGYAVVTDKEFLENNPHIPAKHYSWYCRDKMPTFSYAEQYMKGMVRDNGMEPDPRLKFNNLRLQLVGYWNPFLDPHQSTATMFYIAVDDSPRLCSYNVVARQFRSVEAALKFGNEQKDIGAMFTSETYLMNRLESFPRVVLSMCNSGVGGEWKSIESDENAIPFNLAAAVKHINEKDYKNVNLVPLNSLWHNRSRIVIFYQEK